LGASTYETSFQTFQTILTQSSAAVDKYAVGAAKAFFKFQLEVVGAFSAVSSAVLALVDKTVSANTSYRIFGESMLLTTEAAKGLKNVTDALGLSIDQMYWDPKSSSKAEVLFKDYANFVKAFPDIDKKFEGLENAQLQVTRLERGFIRLSEVFTVSIFNKLGGSELTKKITGWVDYLLDGDKIVALGDKLADFFAPILTHTYKMFIDIGSAVKQFSDDFSDLIGVVTGDDSINETTNSFEKFGKALTHVIDFAAALVRILTALEHVIANVLKLAVPLVSALFLPKGIFGAVEWGVNKLSGWIDSKEGGRPADKAKGFLNKGPSASFSSGGVLGALADAIEKQEDYRPGTLAYKNNNPGNLIYNKYTAAWGATPGAGGFAKFQDYAAGRAAEERQLKIDANRGMTLSEAIGAWAPASDPRNDTAAYIQHVAAATGISPNQKLSSAFTINGGVHVNVAKTNANPEEIAQAAQDQLHKQVQLELLQISPLC
jgi:hypothetical protein